MHALIDEVTIDPAARDDGDLDQGPQAPVTHDSSPADPLSAALLKVSGLDQIATVVTLD